MPHPEFHRTAHIGWLRAAVFGANDGLISTSSLIVGVAAAQADKAPVLLAACAGMVAGALSMAAGEYELGMTDTSQARPLQAALASAAAFALGAAPPVLLVLLLPLPALTTGVAITTLLLLLFLGALAAKLGGAPMVRGALRVGFWGAVAMIVTAIVGRLFGAAV